MNRSRHIWTSLLLIFIWALLVLGSGKRWQDTIRPKLFFQMTQHDYISFRGNISGPIESHDFFSTILYESEHLLVGARNCIYKLSISAGNLLNPVERIDWPTSLADRKACLVKGHDNFNCQNYIRILAKYEKGSNYLICGTNAFYPMCRKYSYTSDGFEFIDEWEGRASCPYSPHHNSTAVLVGEDIYAGTAADRSGIDSLVYRKPLRTRQYDAEQLNDPDFVGSLSHKNHVYFFFREMALEYSNCGRAIYSRVARVCRNDKGESSSSETWTSFFKARLNCSIPSEFPFYFDEIRAVSPLIRSHIMSANISLNDDEDLLVYAAFSTPSNSVGGSAICLFVMKDIETVFNRGKFKEQKDRSANWLPVPDNKVPKPRPGTCADTNEKVDINFVRKHPLMDEAVRSLYGKPIFVRTGQFSQFNALVVDAQVSTIRGKFVDVIFIGTTSGRVIKITNTAAGLQTVVIEELQVFGSTDAIQSLLVVGGRPGRRKSLGQLIVSTKNELRSFPVQRCDRATTCAKCVALQDPYCAWDIRLSRCGSGDWSANMARFFLQSIETGVHPDCFSRQHEPGGFQEKRKLPGSSLFESRLVNEASVPEIRGFSNEFDSGTPLGQVVNIIVSAAGNQHNSLDSHGDEVIRRNKQDETSEIQVVESKQVFSLETLVTTVSIGAVVALIVGFLTGYSCGHRCRKDNISAAAATLASLPPYDETSNEGFVLGSARGRHRVPGSGIPLLGMEEEVTYAEPDLPAVMSGLSRISSSSGGSRFNTISHSNKSTLPSSSRHVHQPFQSNFYEQRELNPYLLRAAGCRGDTTLNRSRGNKGNRVLGLEHQEVVLDSAYGTNRSVKKVYL